MKNELTQIPTHLIEKLGETASKEMYAENLKQLDFSMRMKKVLWVATEIECRCNRANEFIQYRRDKHSSQNQTAKNLNMLLRELKS